MSVFAEEENNRYIGVSTKTIYNLTDEEREVLEKKSFDGDAAASFRLYEYYSLSNPNLEKEFQYLEVAATQGHPIAQYNLGCLMTRIRGPYTPWYDLDKAIYWMEKSAKNGDKEAKRNLPKLKKVKKGEAGC